MELNRQGWLLEPCKQAILLAYDLLFSPAVSLCVKYAAQTHSTDTSVVSSLRSWQSTRAR